MVIAEPGTWIKLNRNILKWKWYSDTETKDVFIHLLLKANVRDGNLHGTPIRRGECITSVRYLAKELNISEQRVRTALKHLADDDAILMECSPMHTRIEIVNYNKYQSFTPAEPKAKKKPTKKSSSAIVDPVKDKTSTEYQPQHWETEIPKHYWGQFPTEDDYWIYAEAHSEEVEQWAMS